MKYLKKVNSTCWVLDHRLNPMVSAMFAAMSSRLPAGGIKQKYKEVVEAIAESNYTKAFQAERKAGHNFAGERYEYKGAWENQNPRTWINQAEETLCKLKLHPIVQEFFDKFVGQYGHASIMECVGQPAVYVEGVSPWTAYMSFDNPLVAGQEFSTRAVRRKDWPMCAEAVQKNGNIADGLVNLHNSWLEIFTAEVEAWKLELQLPCDECDGMGKWATMLGPDECKHCEATGKKYSFIKDPQAFRPALDRARWAIPSTIATGFCHTANPRVMGRVIQQGQDFSTDSTVWSDIKDAYEQALPGMAGMWSKEAVAGDTTNTLAQHINIGFVQPGPEVTCDIKHQLDVANTINTTPARTSNRTYLDPVWNQLVRVNLEFQCSWAVARDWHRHRTAFPWSFNIVRYHQLLGMPSESFHIHKAYKELCSNNETNNLWQKSTELFNKFRAAGDMEKAMLCLPFGTLVSMKTSMGLRDAVYMLELRANAHGANFEYEAQAKEALKQLRQQLAPFADHILGKPT